MALRTPAFNDAKTYGFEWVRAGTIESMLQEGVLNFGGAGTDLKTTAAAGGGMRVDVAAGAALVKGDSGVPATGLTQGLFFAVNDASIANAATLGAANGTLPRIDQIALRVRDSSDLGTGADDAAIIVVAGVATSGATLDNRSGAGALPNDCIRLADVLVPAAAVAVSAANVRDRRPWARGAAARLVRTSGNVTGLTSTGLAAIDTAALRMRLELGPNPIRVTGIAAVQNSNAGAYTNLGILDNAAGLEGFTSLGNGLSPAAAQATGCVFDHLTAAMAAGSHLLDFAYNVNAGTATIFATAANPLSFAVEEIVRPNANNGTT